jgi:hypothetical protein
MIKVTVASELLRLVLATGFCIDHRTTVIDGLPPASEAEVRLTAAEAFGDHIVLYFDDGKAEVVDKLILLRQDAPTLAPAHDHPQT